MNRCRVSIITPTLRRDIRVVERCLGSVTGQTLPDWEHLVCSVGQYERDVDELVRRLGDKRRRYGHVAKRLGHFGAGIRQKLGAVAAGEFLAFLDDDNVIFPKFAEYMVGVLEQNPDVAFAICQIVYCSPLPRGGGPIIINGVPPARRNIDTLQVVVRKSAMLQTGWCLKGYQSDGYTYEKLARQYRWITVNEVLGMKL